jgi:hypothetical protein
VLLIDVAAGHELAVPRQQIDQRPRRLGDRPAPERVPKDPGVAGADAAADVVGQAVLSLPDDGARRAAAHRWSGAFTVHGTAGNIRITFLAVKRRMGLPKTAIDFKRGKREPSLWV